MGPLFYEISITVISPDGNRYTKSARNLLSSEQAEIQTSEAFEFPKGAGTGKQK
jgi:hypothetical protein